MITQTFPSSSSSKVYTVRLDPATGQATCDCPAWKFVKAGQPRGCKHTRAVGTSTPVAPTPRPVVVPRPVPASVLATLPKPMLASALTAGQTLAQFATVDWILEEKLDGHRTLIVRQGATVTATSRPRAGEAEGRVQSLPPALASVLADLPEGIYDGELCTPGGKSWDVARLDTAKHIVLFDVLQILGQDVTRQTYAERRGLLLVAVQHCGGDPLVTVNAAVPVSQSALDAIFAKGGEGCLLKRVHSRYQPGVRSMDWIKLKSIQHATVTVTGFEAGKGGPYAKIAYRTSEGIAGTVKTLNVGTMREIAANPQAFIGRRLVVQYMGKTPSGRYRHPMHDHWAGDGE